MACAGFAELVAAVGGRSQCGRRCSHSLKCARIRLAAKGEARKFVSLISDTRAEAGTSPGTVTSKCAGTAHCINWRFSSTEHRTGSAAKGAQSHTKGDIHTASATMGDIHTTSTTLGDIHTTSATLPGRGLPLGVLALALS
jgi:hypothetical protein